MSGKIDPKALEEALHFTEENYKACTVCARRCGVNRYESSDGFCGLGEGAKIYKEYLHFGEEDRLLPSHTIYFTGCSMRCAFCSDWEQVTNPLANGVEVAPELLAKRIAKRRKEGAKNVNFVGGVPDVNLLYILRVLSHCPSDTHVVWNTNLYSTPTVVKKLQGIIGTWLVDLKFGNDLCGKKLARSPNYFQTLVSLLDLIPDERLVIRHLLMPGHLECCTLPVISWLETHRPGAPLNLMTGYSPFQMARTSPKHPMAHRLSETEKNLALEAFSKAQIADKMLDGKDWDGQF